MHCETNPSLESYRLIDHLNRLRRMRLRDVSFHDGSIVFQTFGAAGILATPEAIGATNMAK